MPLRTLLNAIRSRPSTPQLSEKEILLKKRICIRCDEVKFNEEFRRTRVCRKCTSKLRYKYSQQFFQDPERRAKRREYQKIWQRAYTLKKKMEKEGLVS